MHPSLAAPQFSFTTFIIILLIPSTAIASAIAKSACTISALSTTTATTTMATNPTIETSSWATFPSPRTASTTVAAFPATTTTALWQIDPMCLPGVAQCHHFGDRFRYCNATGYWVPNYCGGDWICCAYSSRNGIGPMCEDRAECEVVGRPGMMGLERWE
ncbi:hypothetical protein AA0121_g9906 [Alternaria tenuissima]|nr:hypothetical protein AA0121_g9906 [Alternaria tenuissima]